MLRWEVVPYKGQEVSSYVSSDNYIMGWAEPDYFAFSGPLGVLDGWGFLYVR